MLKIGVVDVTEREGGRRTFVDNFYATLKKEGYDVHLVDLVKCSLKGLNSFDILHFSTHFWGKHTWKLLLATRPTKLLTVHGWVKKENSYLFKNARTQLGLVASSRMLLFHFFSFVFLKTTSLIFDAITCPSKRTASENSLKNVTIISNALSAECFDGIPSIDVRHGQSEILFVTYVSIGGLKNVAVDRTISVVIKINQILRDRQAILLVFGKDYPCRVTSPYVRFMGFSDKFLGILKSSDLFITGKTFPDLGYVEMEAGALGIPVAKFVAEWENEEIVDGRTGILAKSEDEMVEKLLDYVLHLESVKKTLGSNLRKYIVREKSWSNVISRWNDLFLHARTIKEKRD